MTDHGFAGLSSTGSCREILFRRRPFFRVDFQMPFHDAIAFGRGRAGIVEHHAHIERLAAIHIGRNGDPLHRHIGCGLRSEREPRRFPRRLRPFAGLAPGRCPCFHCRRSQTRPAGRHLPETMPSPISARRQCSCDRSSIRVSGVRLDLNFVVVRRMLHRRIAAKNNHAGKIVAGFMRCFLMSAFTHSTIARRCASRNADRLIEQINDRHLVAGPHHLHFGQRQQQSAQHRRAATPTQTTAAPAPAPERLRKLNHHSSGTTATAKATAESRKRGVMQREAWVGRFEERNSCVAGRTNLR